VGEMSDEDEGDDQAAQGFMRGWNSGLNYILLPPG